MMHCISLGAGERLLRLGEHFELVWATGWEQKANDYLPNILGLPELPYLTFDGAARFGSAHWKLGPLDEYGSGRALAWIDDSFDQSCYEWARDRDEPTLLVPTESALGLEEAQTEALIAWAKSLAVESSRLTAVIGFWPIFFLLVVLKIPVLGSLWLVWWASQRTPEPETAEEDSGGGPKRRRPGRSRPRGPHTRPHGGAARPRIRTRPAQLVSDRRDGLRRTGADPRPHLRQAG